tara:strand:+ start:1117 stop:1356 length:240 start_codon:yes stop_codon:yes gene_type:complete
MDDKQPLSDQFPVIEGKVMGLNLKNDKTTLALENENLKYKFWMALIRLSELTHDVFVDDGEDFAYDIEEEIAKLQDELQ